MKKLIEFFGFCIHEWEIESKCVVYSPPQDLFAFEWEGKPKKLPIGTRYTLRCKKCGELKTHNDY